MHSASNPGILALDISPKNPSIILTGGNDRQAVVFNKDSEQVVATLKGHQKKVTHVIHHFEEVSRTPFDGKLTRSFLSRILQSPEARIRVFVYGIFHQPNV